jgi:NADH-quinone oxidoreductase subunit L
VIEAVSDTVTTAWAGTTALWLLVALPAAVGALLCLGGRGAERVAGPVAVATAAIGSVLAGAVAVLRPAVSAPFVAGAPLGLAVDTLSAITVCLVAVVSLLVLVFSSGAITTSRARFHGLMLLFLAAVIVTASATTLPALLLGWEVMGATSYALIGFSWQDRQRVSGGATAFLTTRAADLGLYAAAAAAVAGGSGMALDRLPTATGTWLHVAAAGVLVAALGKAAQLPFSFWLSRAMEGPSPVSALLHSAAMVAMGGYLLLRVGPLLQASGWAAPAAAWIGALTALLLGAVALAQRDLKQLLAASTSAQLGFVVLAAGVSAVAGGTAHLVAHAATKALLFLAAGAWLGALGTKALPALAGVARRWPVVGVAATIGALALAGVAPLSLWATKDAVLAGALEHSAALYVVGLAAAALAAAYAGKVLVVVWRTAAEAEERLDTEEAGTRHVHRVQQAPLVVLAAGAAVLGVLALPPVVELLAHALGQPPPPTGGPWELGGSAVLALVVLGLVRWAMRARVAPPRAATRWAASWLGLEAATQAVVVRPALALSKWLARVDDRVLDRAVTGAARGALAVGRGAARVDVGGVDAAVEGLARGVRALGVSVRRLQTGQLHHYYLGAVAVLAACVVLLVLAR